MEKWNQLSPSMQGVLIALIVLQTLLTLVAVVWWARTPAERQTLPKPVWLLIILAANTLGPIAWFAAGRKPISAQVVSAVNDWSDQQTRAVDVLYGKKKDAPR